MALFDAFGDRLPQSITVFSPHPGLEVRAVMWSIGSEVDLNVSRGKETFREACALHATDRGETRRATGKEGAGSEDPHLRFRLSDVLDVAWSISWVGPLMRVEGGA